ncbi:uncharacterized protein ARB_01079 [Trichophyton benhamiae CBS 112371]|uniref:Uncharacterized protein n=1 Tax=Arthroderma benhamiae (strain ATCC MYA-4681 / CBS 112371) TaxID=663331 RepID=D4AY10_ARTBC|nr:uncharacterized protein ARB_01079 [Trichophyton benhamiae CBS 112371]EFE32188.1 hypothetical protein ARB_01079 [Trichophyton benhamiae CBS 112371]
MAVKATTSSNQTRSASYAEEVGEKKERVRGNEKSRLKERRTGAEAKRGEEKREL